MISRPTATPLLTLLLTLLVGSGCDKVSEVLEDPGKAVQQQVETVQQSASQAMETVKQTVGASGSAELTLDQPVSASACYATLVQPGAGRSAILEIKSYRTPEEEKYPSYMFHGNAPGTSWPQLAGQTISGQFFVRSSADGPIWYSDREQPVEVRITASNGETIEAEIASGSLTSTDGTPLPTLSGKFHAIVRTVE